MVVGARIGDIMRVLVVHNRYRSDNPSGENAVVDLEIELLRSAGVEVEAFQRSSDDLQALPTRDRLSLAASPVHSRTSVKQVETVIARFRPDVLHLHNPYPLISPAVLRVASRAGVATVVTAHNYRLTCANGLFFRDGKGCHACERAAVPYPAVVHACYRGSRPQSAAIATSLLAHRGTWKAVDRFVALSPPIRDFLLSYGIPADRIALKANTVRDPGPPAPLGSSFLFAARLSVEKGVELLIEAWSRHPEGSLGELRIAGDGPLRGRVQTWAARRSDVSYLGLRQPSDMPGLMRDAAVVIVAPIWEDSCPMTAIEAMACGRPVLATTRGGLPYLLGSDGGWLVSDNASSVAAGLMVAANATEDDQVRARNRYLREFAPGPTTDALLHAYEAARAR
jgi:glycosyltransferase involved in cell wall biosynthesis